MIGRLTWREFDMSPSRKYAIDSLSPPSGLRSTQIGPSEATERPVERRSGETDRRTRVDPFLSAEGLTHHRRIDRLAQRVAELERECDRKANIISDLADQLASAAVKLAQR